MKLYNGTIRLETSVLHEQEGKDMTAAEILLIRFIHGGHDAVVNVTESGETDRSDWEELERLRRSYQAGSVEKVFGVGATRVPHELPPEPTEEVPEEKPSAAKDGMKIAKPKRAAA